MLVLIVEAEPGTVGFIETVLRNEGISTRVAADLNGLIRGLGLEPRPDLVLLDDLPPDVSALAVLERIRRQPRLEKIPVVVMTSQTGPTEVAKGLVLGANGHLSKPARPQALVDAIRSVLGVRPAPAAPAPAAARVSKDTSPTTGARLGPYEILDVLGSGGMGIVYRAWDTRLDRAVGLKMLPEEADLSERSMVRFLREAKAASTLNHPNICTVHDIGQHEGRPYIIMECLVGQTLFDKLGNGPLETDTFLEFATQLTRGLEAAHRAGIVHRDLKPANIFITDSGLVKILDFGLAKPLSVPPSEVETQDGGRSGPSTRNLTLTGVAAGTPGYLSPEQALGRPLDARSDLFSLGIVLFEMATGQLPPSRDTDAASYEVLLHEPAARPSQLNASVPAWADRVVESCCR